MGVQGDLADMHTACLNRLAGAFQPSACHGLSFQDRGYDGFLDPKLNSTETDFMSMGDSDVQHYKVVGAKTKLGDPTGIINDEDEIIRQLQETVSFQRISDSVVEEFLTKKDHSLQLSLQESVALVPSEAYSQHEDCISDFLSSNELCIWVITLNGNKIKKRHGHHDVTEIDELVSDAGSRDGIHLHDIDCSICPVVRDSDMQLIKLLFAKRLITYSYQSQVTEIQYDDIDEIMLGSRVPILGHLPPDQRDDYWQQCMLTLKNTCGVISGSKKGVDLYQWDKERFLYDKSARSNLIEEIRSDLGIGEEA